MDNIFIGDCVQYAKQFSDGYFDLIIADPPYFEIHGAFDFIWSSLNEYLDWCHTWIRECHRILSPTGSFYLWGKIGYGKGFPLFKIADWIETEKLFIIRNWITQRNSRGRGTKKGYMEAREELIFMTGSADYTWNTAYTKEPSKRKDMGANDKPRKNKFKRCSDVWIDITEASQSSKERFYLPDGSTFPTTKALNLCRRIIEASSNPGDHIFIPFGGSGSEAVAAIELGREWYLCEKNEYYVEHIITPRIRTAQEHAQISGEQLHF